MQEIDFNPGWAFWLIIVPFINVLTRLRANYLPRAVSLDHVMEAGREEEPRQKSWIKSIFAWRYYENPKIGPNVRTFLPMAKRVYQIEGVRSRSSQLIAHLAAYANSRSLCLFSCQLKC